MCNPSWAASTLRVSFGNDYKYLPWQLYHKAACVCRKSIACYVVFLVGFIGRFVLNTTNHISVLPPNSLCFFVDDCINNPAQYCKTIMHLISTDRQPLLSILHDALSCKDQHGSEVKTIGIDQLNFVNCYGWRWSTSHLL